MNRVGRFFENLLFPPKCVGCRKLFQKNILDPCETPYCDRCRLSWEREKGESCPDCGLEMFRCRCGGKLAESVGVSDCIKLVSYQKERETVGRRAVLYMKKHSNRVAVSFFAEQLSYPLRRYMDEHMLTPDDVVLCCVPRGRKSVDQYGFDHAEKLCVQLAKQIGVKALPELLYRQRTKSREQKKLTTEERAQNASGAFAVDDKLLASLGTAKCLFIVDDVITTGASIGGCATLLRMGYDGPIVAICIARTAIGRRKSAKVRG